MIRNIDRRTLIKGAAGASVAGAAAVASKRSSVFAAPNVIKQTGSNVEVNYWYGFSGQLGETMQSFIDEFNGLGTGVTVNGLQQANYEETAQTLGLALQDGTYPDIALLSDVWWFRFYLANTLLPLNDLIGSTGYDTADLVQSLYTEGVREGVSYWLPVARSTPLLYYNVDMFEAAGISELPETWSGFAEVAPSLVDEGQQIYAFAHPPAASYIAWLFHGVAWAFGGGYSEPDFTITVDSPGTIAAGQYYLDSVQNGWAYAPEDQEQDFANGFVAAVMASTGSLANITNISAETGVNFRTAFLRAELPEVEEYCCTGGSGLSIMADIPAERQQAAFSFIEFMNSTDVTTRWSQRTGYMPVRTSAVESEAMQTFFAENPNFQTAVEQLPQTRPQDAARVFIPGGDQIIGGGLEAIVVNGEDPASAFAAVKAELEAEAQPVIEQVIAVEGDLGTPAATPAARRFF